MTFSYDIEVGYQYGSRSARNRPRGEYVQHLLADTGGVLADPTPDVQVYEHLGLCFDRTAQPAR